jgi:putative ABC transport system permease protein
MHTLAQDLRYALRTMRKTPGFSLIAILTLALGIGASTSIFSVVDAVLLRPLPYHAPDAIVRVWEHDRLRGTDREGFSAPDYFDLLDQQRAFSALAALRSSDMTLTGRNAEPERVSVASVTHTFFDVLGRLPALGRTFTADEDRPNGPLVAVLSHEFWTARLGADPSVAGTSITIDGQPYEIVGVMSPGLPMPRPITAVWVPLRAGPRTSSRGVHNLGVVARLKPEATMDQAQQDVAAVARRLEERYTGDNKGRGMHLVALREAVSGEVRPALLVLLGAVLAVLLITCANIANLLLARAVERSREVAVRTALGAGRARLVRQFLTESVLLALVAGALGVALAHVGLRALLQLAPDTLPRIHEIGIDPRVLAFTIVVSLATGILFGLVPSLQTFRVDLQHSLKDGSRTATGAGQRFQRVLVVAELALSVMLVIGATLLARSFWNLQNVDPGFRAENVLKLEYQLPAAKYPQSFRTFPDWPEVLTFNRQTLDRISALPGASSTALAASPPLDEGWTTRYQIAGRPPVPEGEQDEVRIRIVSPGYFRTVGIPLLRGRGLEDRDRHGASQVTLINEAGVRRYFPNEDPIGRQIAVLGRPLEIVGVVGNERFMGLTEETPPALYPPIDQMPTTAVSLLVRTGADAERLVGSIRREISAMDPALALFRIETLDTVLSQAVAQPRFNMLLLGLFAVVALVMALVGVHGILSYAVSRRSQEIGLRVALGATPRHVLGLILAQGAGLAAIGLALGVAGAFALTRALATMLFGISLTDPATFAGVPLVLGLVAIVASYLPARRALRVDPIDALRNE